MNICMADLETYSTYPTAAIASIGAVVANVKEKKIIGEYYCNVSPFESKQLGLHFRKETMDWWKAQSKEAIAALVDNQRPIKESIEGLYDFYTQHQCSEIWAWGASFDFPIIKHSGLVSGCREEPWEYWQAKCARSFCAEFDMKPERIEGKHHNAMEDSKAQMITLLNLKDLLSALHE